MSSSTLLASTSSPAATTTKISTSQVSSATASTVLQVAQPRQTVVQPVAAPNVIPSNTVPDNNPSDTPQTSQQAQATVISPSSVLSLTEQILQTQNIEMTSMLLPTETAIPVTNNTVGGARLDIILPIAGAAIFILAIAMFGMSKMTSKRASSPESQMPMYKDKQLPPEPDAWRGRDSGASSVQRRRSPVKQRQSTFSDQSMDINTMIQHMNHPLAIRPNSMSPSSQSYTLPEIQSPVLPVDLFVNVSVPPENDIKSAHGSVIMESPNKSRPVKSPLRKQVLKSHLSREVRNSYESSMFGSELSYQPPNKQYLENEDPRMSFGSIMSSNAPSYATHSRIWEHAGFDQREMYVDEIYGSYSPQNPNLRDSSMTMQSAYTPQNQRDSSMTMQSVYSPYYQADASMDQQQYHRDSMDHYHRDSSVTMDTTPQNPNLRDSSMTMQSIYSHIEPVSKDEE